MSIQSEIDRIENEVQTQENLIARISNALNGKASGGGGGTADSVEWDNIQNKPFCEEDVLIQWDGDTTDKVGVHADGISFYKVSDEIPTKAQLEQAEYIMYAEGEYVPLTLEDQGGVNEFFGALMVAANVIVVPSPNLTVEEIGTFTETGVYFMWVDSTVYFHSVKYAKETINPEALPPISVDWEDVQNKPFGATPTVLCDGTYETAFSDEWGMYAAIVPSEDAVLGAGGDTFIVEWDGVMYQCVSMQVFGMEFFGNVPLMMGAGDTGEPFAVIIENGLFTIIDTHASGSDSHTVKITKNVIDKIPKEYVETKKTLYISDGYLYNDAYLTEKVTSVQLDEYIRFYTVQVTIASDGMVDGSRLPILAYYAGTYGTVIVMSNISGDKDNIKPTFAAYYTAEYTG